MVLQRKHKVYGSILALGIGVVIVDRAVVLGPNDAAAAMPVSAAAPSAVADPAPAATPAASDAATTNDGIAQRLSRLRDFRSVGATGTPDAFRLPSRWVSERTTASVTPQQFRQTHRLQGVMANTRGEGSALVDGRWLEPGAALDGYRLVAVDNRAALFVGHGQRVVLSLDTTSR